jgi:RNA polymerase sigma factor for flagellar operon FliA
MQANNNARRPHLPCRKAQTARANRCKSSRDRLVEQHHSLVARIAKKVSFQIRHRIEEDELMGWGYTGLLEAADRYVAGGPASFSTFAYHRVRGAMLDGIGAIAPLTRNGYRKAKEREDVQALFPKELDEATMVDEESLSYPADARLEDKELIDLLREALEELPERQRELIRAHYWGGATLLDAGKDLGISKSWACRTHAKALSTLRRHVEAAA